MVTYFSRLTGSVPDNAERYIRFIPSQAPALPDVRGVQYDERNVLWTLIVIFFHQRIYPGRERVTSFSMVQRIGITMLALTGDMTIGNSAPLVTKLPDILVQHVIDILCSYPSVGATQLSTAVDLF